jgi:hypothetical protein
MRYASMAKVAIVLIVVCWLTLFTADGACGDECSDILKQGIFDELKYENIDQFQADLRLVLKLSKKERETYMRDRQGSLSVGLAKILTLGLAAGDSEEYLKELNETLAVNQSLALKHDKYTWLQTKLVSRPVVEAWEKCMRNHSGLSCELVGGENEKGEFLLLLKYRPTKLTDAKQLKITDVRIVGAEPVGRQTVKENGFVGSYTGASQLLRRKGKEAVSVLILLEGVGPLQASLPAVSEEKVPKPDVITSVAVRSYTQRNKERVGVVNVWLFQKDEKNAVLAPMQNAQGGWGAREVWHDDNRTIPTYLGTDKGVGFTPRRFEGVYWLVVKLDATPGDKNIDWTGNVELVLTIQKPDGSVRTVTTKTPSIVFKDNVPQADSEFLKDWPGLGGKAYVHTVKWPD